MCNVQYRAILHDELTQDCKCLLHIFTVHVYDHIDNVNVLQDSRIIVQNYGADDDTLLYGDHCVQLLYGFRNTCERHGAVAGMVAQA